MHEKGFGHLWADGTLTAATYADEE